MSFLMECLFPLIGITVCVAIFGVGLQTYAEIYENVKFIRERIEKITTEKQPM